MYYQHYQHYQYYLSFLQCLSYRFARNLEPITGDLGHKAEHILDRMPVYHRVQLYTHLFKHYRQFRDATQPTMQVYGLGKETGKLQRHRESKQAPHSWQWWESNSQPWWYDGNVVTTKPLFPTARDYGGWYQERWYQRLEFVTPLTLSIKLL